MELLFPVIILIFLKLILVFRLLYMATQSIKNKKVRLSQFRIYQGEFPDELLSARQQLENMFQVPILFYLLCVINISLNDYNQLDIIFAWGFVLFRVIHFFIRLQNQKNINIIPRTISFIISLIFLTLGWINLFINKIVL